MPAKTSYAHGTPNWVDLQTSDQNGARTFYGALFGWSFDDQPMAGGQVYSMASKAGGVVCAIAPQSPEQAAAGAPPTWNTYIAVDDVDAAAQRVTAAGGTLAMEPFDVMDAGRMAFAFDPSGAGILLWQANTHAGATVVNEPGTVIWNELVTPDLDAALPFYSEVFGITAEASEMAGSTYTSLKVAGEPVGGATTPQADGVPSHWGVYFCVEDAAATAAKVVDLGGTVVSGPFDTPIGPMAVLRDPQGGSFSIFSATPSS